MFSDSGTSGRLAKQAFRAKAGGAGVFGHLAVRLFGDDIEHLINRLAIRGLWHVGVCRYGYVDNYLDSFCEPLV